MMLQSIFFISLLLIPLSFRFPLPYYRHPWYWIIALVMAIFLWVGSPQPWMMLTTYLQPTSALNPVRILGLFFGFSTLAIFLDQTGFFEALATMVLSRIHGQQKPLFLGWYGFVGLLTMFTANDIVILTLTPFIIYFTHHAKIDPIPYLVAQFVAANTWSMFFLFGNPTNLYLASQFQLSFGSFTLWMALPTFMAAIGGYFLLYGMFQKRLQQPFEQPLLQPVTPHPYARWGVLIFALLIVSMSVFSSLISLDVLVGVAVFLLLLRTLWTSDGLQLWKKTFHQLPYPFIPFFLGMSFGIHLMMTFPIHEAMEAFLGELPPLWGFGWMSFFGSNVLNNIPMTVWFTSWLQASPRLENIYAVIIGSNLGALLTPVGSLAGLMWMTQLQKKQIPWHWIDFVKMGFVLGMGLMVISLLSLASISVIF